MAGQDTLGWGDLQEFLAAETQSPGAKLRQGLTYFEEHPFREWGATRQRFWGFTMMLLTALHGQEDWHRMKAGHMYEILDGFAWANCNAIELYGSTAKRLPARMFKSIKLQKVRFMPKTLEPGILYASEEYGAVAHLCACGCAAKIRTPLGPTDWRFEDTPEGPTLVPSIGNWQQACRSHYWIRRGAIVPASSWTDEEILFGRAMELERDRAYFEHLPRDKRPNLLKRLWNCILGRRDQ